MTKERISSNSSRSNSIVSRLVHLDLDEVDRETEKIKEETLRIQKEIEEKVEENKRLAYKLESKGRRFGEYFMINKFLKAILRQKGKKGESNPDIKSK